MSAEYLRETARLMRERAEARTPGPWRYDENVYHDHGAILSDSTDERAKGWGHLVMDVKDAVGHEDNAEYIASWHPGVALAVADLVEEGIAFASLTNPRKYPVYVKAMAVARAYRRGESS